MRRTPVLALLVVLPILAFLAGCGASGGDDASGGSDGKATTTAASSTGDDDDGTGDDTDEPVDDPTTTEAEGSADAPTSEALVGILPTAADIGAGYEVADEDLSGTEDPDDDESDDEEDPTEQAIMDACPGAEVLNELDTGEASPEEVSREFETEADQSVEVALDPAAADFTEETVDQVVEALADCGTIKTSDDEVGDIEMTIKAEKTDDYGDYGVRMSMDATFELFGSPLQIQFRGVIFSANGVTVSVVASSGLDDATFEFVPGDYDLVPDLATSMQEQVEAL